MDISKIMNTIINRLEKKQYTNKKEIDLRPGDTVEVKIWVVESSKKRLQAFEGIIIAIRKRGIHSSFTIRRMSHGEGIERTFQIYSPTIDSIFVKRHSSVRKAKLYYLRKKIGKSARIKEKLN